MLTLEEWPFSGTTTAAVVFLTIYILLYRLQTLKKHHDEPPIVTSALPFLGPLLGMVLRGGKHIKTIGLKNLDKPIFTLPVPFSRLYIVTDPALAAAVQRTYKTLSVMPIIPESTKRILGLDRDTVDLISRGMEPEPGEPDGFLSELHDMVYSYFGPGDDLNALTMLATKEFANEVNAYAAQLQGKEKVKPGGGGGGGGGQAVVDLQLWVRHIATVASAAMVYGPNNPIALDPSLEEAFWDFDHGLGTLLLNIFPSVTSPKAYRGRERFQQALRDYLKAGHQRDAADIIKRRLAIAASYNWKEEMMGREELSFFFATVVNTATTGFWFLLHLYARPALLAEVRSELAPAIQTVQADNGAQETQIHLETLKASCPVLTSVFREVLRLGSDSFSTRVVKADTMLAGRDWLAKNAVVQVSGGVIHADTSIWGDDAADFNPYRFAKLNTRVSKEDASGTATLDLGKKDDRGGEVGPPPNAKTKGPEKQVHPAAFRAFGGGRTMCPGRHFATNEILALAAMVILTFDMESVDGKPLNVPPKNDEVLPIHILEPKAGEVVNVRVRLRNGNQTPRVRVV